MFWVLCIIAILLGLILLAIIFGLHELKQFIALVSDRNHKDHDKLFDKAGDAERYVMRKWGDL